MRTGSRVPKLRSLHLLCAQEGKAKGKSVVGINLIGQTVGFLVIACAQCAISIKRRFDLHNTKQQTHLL